MIVAGCLFCLLKPLLLLFVVGTVVVAIVGVAFFGGGNELQVLYVYVSVPFSLSVSEVHDDWGNYSAYFERAGILGS